MASIVEIGANALRLLGADPITDLGDDSDGARLVNALWPQARDGCLRAHPWKFARKRAQLAKLADAPLWEYANAFQLPTNPWCLRVLKTDLDESDLAWVVEGRTIVTDASSVRILYIARITDPGDYDASFEVAVTAKLAADLAYPIVASTAKAREMLELYAMKLVEARFLDSTEAAPTGMRSDDLVTARFAGRAQLPIRVWP